MLFYIMVGMLSAASFMLLLLKFDIKKVLYFDVPIDIIFSSIMMYIFFGTFSGMVSSAIGGVTLSLSLLLCKKSIGYKKPKFSLRKGIIWEEICN